jgi:hypothetical protein
MGAKFSVANRTLGVDFATGKRMADMNCLWQMDNSVATDRKYTGFFGVDTIIGGDFRNILHSDGKFFSWYWPRARGGGYGQWFRRMSDYPGRIYPFCHIVHYLARSVERRL